jgi:hypothetical protein
MRKAVLLVLLGLFIASLLPGGSQAASAGFADVVITEILAANISVRGLVDEDGEVQDWIEIHNRGASSVNLMDWSLSDDPDLPALWTFPARLLAPGEYLVVFASGKDRKPSIATGKLHTNFKLSDVGEHLGLYTPESPRALASGFTPYPEQRNDVSYGLDSSGALRYFDIPTPGQANGASTIIGTCAAVHVNVSRGHFNAPFELTLSCATPEAVFRYTTDGSVPTTDSRLFPTSLRITNTTLFRAAAFKTNFLPSKTITHSYLFNLPANLRSLPVVSIVTATNNLYGKTGILGINGGNYNAGPWAPNPGATNDYHNPSKHGLTWERPTSVEWIRPEDNSGFQTDCGLRVQGSDYQRPRLTRTSKFSFRLYFRGDYGPGRLEYPLFPLTSVQRFDQIVLRAGFNEQGNPFIRDEIHRRLSHDMGQVASHGTLAIVLVNGVYYSSSPWYNPCERVHEEFLQEHLGGGNEWDVVGPSFATSAGAAGVVDGDRTDFANLVNYVRTQTVTNPPIYLEIGRRLDLTNFVDYCLLNAYAAMGDWPANNWRAGRERSPNGIWRFIVWDAEWGMGIYDRTVSINCFTQTGAGPNDSGLGSVNSSEIARIYDRLRASAEFRLLWADRVQKHFFNGGALTRANITNRFEELRREMLALIPSMETEIPQWARDRQSIFFGHMLPYGLLASSNAPAFSQFGGRVPRGFNLAMTNLAGTIYYTTDGTDPRVRFTSAIAPIAAAYTGPVPLASTTTVLARSLQGTNWSALSEAAFTVESLGLPLRITEIMYNPSGGSTYEFLELQNTGNVTLDLGGMSLDGVNFIFKEGTTLAGGARLVLGANTDTNAWKTRYPGVQVFGWFSGSLNNAGERLALLNRNGDIIASVDYKPRDGWPAAAGAGASLEIIRTEGDPNDPANWQSSAQAGGTPSAANSLVSPPLIFLNEVMAENLGAVSNGITHPDWVELHNPGGTAVNLAGWSLGDSGDVRRYVFPTGTSIPALGYQVVWCDASTNTTPGQHTGFGLDRDGESVFLYDSTTNRIDAVTFGHQLANYSIGRVQGDWVLATPTPGAANAAAAVGSQTNLAINEWLASPLPGGSDWVELFNRSLTEPVALRGLYLGTTGLVQRLHSLSFIAPGGYAQLFADEGVRPDRLDFKLPAGGGSIVLYDATGAEVQRAVYGAPTNGVSQGRLPDGQTNVVNFPGSASPGARNYTASYNGTVVNEVLARNRSTKINGEVAGFIELYNPAAFDFDLGGMSLSVNRPDAGQWVFPPNTVLRPGGYLVLTCAEGRPASTKAGAFHLAQTLGTESGGVYLFNGAGQLVNSVEYGFQIEDLPIGRIDGMWRLLATPTPGATNALAATLGASTALRVNEWMADPVAGADWFEIYNSTNRPVDLSAVSLTDDPSIAGRGQFRPVPLSYIAAGGFVQWIADSDAGQGRQHVNFKLDAAGDSILIYNVSGTIFTPVDAVAFGAQTPGVSQGRWPDGVGSIVAFRDSATPGAPNALRPSDTDQDGIPDTIELQMGLNPLDAADGRADADGDGATNAQEYLAGTDHRDVKSFLKLDRVSVAGSIQISFNAVSNRTYSVFYTDSLTAPTWRKLADVPARATSGVVSVADGSGVSVARFYRLVMTTP